MNFKKILLLILISTVLIFMAIKFATPVNHNTNTKIRILKYAEMVYMEAQVDALNGNVRIRHFPDNKGNADYKWISSPWDSGRTPGYGTLSEYKKMFGEFVGQK